MESFPFAILAGVPVRGAGVGVGVETAGAVAIGCVGGSSSFSFVRNRMPTKTPVRSGCVSQ